MPTNGTLPPTDPKKLDPITTLWPTDKLFYRVHGSQRAATSFNPGYGRGRFHPFSNTAGCSVPTLYGAEQIDGALSETVFRGVPAVGALRGIRRRSLAGLALSVLAPKRDLQLVDLTGHGLRRLGLQRNQLLETEAEHYAQSANWAAALHACNEKLDGLLLISRQFDTAAVILLFGDRVNTRSLINVEPPLTLYRGRGYQHVMEVAEIADMVILN